MQLMVRTGHIVRDLTLSDMSIDYDSMDPVIDPLAHDAVHCSILVVMTFKFNGSLMTID